MNPSKRIFLLKLCIYSIHDPGGRINNGNTSLNIYTYEMICSTYLLYLTDLAVLLNSRVPLSCDTIWSIHPVLDIRTVHIVLRIHHLLLLFNNNTNSLLLRRLLWDWLVAPQERWVCTKLPMYVLSTFLLPFHIIVVTTLYYRGRYKLKFAFPNEGM